MAATSNPFTIARKYLVTLEESDALRALPYRSREWHDESRRLFSRKSLELTGAISKARIHEPIGSDFHGLIKAQGYVHDLQGSWWITCWLHSVAKVPRKDMLDRGTVQVYLHRWLTHLEGQYRSGQLPFGRQRPSPVVRTRPIPVHLQQGTQR